MSRSGTIKTLWAGEERTFRLGIKDLERLQERCGERGPKRILDDLCSGEWKVRDIVETVRLGLIGGGLPAPKADKLVVEHVEERPLSENLFFAVGILQAAITGPPIPDEKVERDILGEPGAAESLTTSPPSTGQEPPSAGALSRQVN